MSLDKAFAPLLTWKWCNKETLWWFSNEGVLIYHFKYVILTPELKQEVKKVFGKLILRFKTIILEVWNCHSITESAAQFSSWTLGDLLNYVVGNLVSSKESH